MTDDLTLSTEKHTATADISLPEVTLICVDTVNPTLAILAMQRCMAHISFGNAILLTAQPLSAPAGITVHLIDGVNDIESYSQFIIRKLGTYIDTTHALVVQWDGYVLHPEAWDPDFLSYDYIGATWPANVQTPEMVGNGGFSLRSKKLLQALDSIEFAQFHPEDEHIARTHRARLASMGIRFAPPEVGDHFAYEFKTPLTPTFGFHGFSNFPDFMIENELCEFIATMPAGLTFNNYFLEFARKVLARSRLHPEEAVSWSMLRTKIARDIHNATPTRQVGEQAKHLISGFCRLGLGALAREMAHRRFTTAPGASNLRLLLKTFFTR